MMFRYNRYVSLLVGACALLGLSAGPASAVVVDCDAAVPPNSVNDEINNNGENFIQFSGTCNENVFIGRSGVTIEGNSGDPTMDVIAQGVFVNGAQNVRLRDFTIEAPSGGAFFVEGAAARLDRMTVQNTRDGLGAVRGAVLRIQDSTIGDASGTDPTFSCGALCIFDHSHLTMLRSTVTSDTNEPGSGGPLIVLRQSSATLRGGNTITSTGSEAAVGIFQNSYLRQDDPSLPQGNVPSNGVDTFNGTLALQVAHMALAEIRHGVFNGDTEVLSESLLRIGSTIFGGDPANIVFNGAIDGGRRSSISILSPLVTINGDITCLDKSSLAQGGFEGTGKYKKCKDFNGKKSKK